MVTATDAVRDIERLRPHLAGMKIVVVGGVQLEVISA
jgi:hypothetical protein